MCRLKKAIFYLGMIAVSMLLSSVSTADLPNKYKSQADNDAQVAANLAAEANQLLQGVITTEKIETAAKLYLRAGQLYEKALNTYKTLRPHYATQEDVENAFAQMNHCIGMIKKVRQLA